jgi:hypothetical protein
MGRNSTTRIATQEKVQHMRALRIKFAIILLTSSWCFALTSPSIASDQQSYSVVGPGRSSCFSWGKARMTRSMVAVSQQRWVEGYLTGFNRYAASSTSNIEKDIPYNGMPVWLDVYCATHADGTLIQAADAFIDSQLNQIAPRTASVSK